MPNSMVSTLPMPESRFKEWTLWALQAGAALVFLVAGGQKLAGSQEMVGIYAALGVGQWFRYVTGIFEVVGALGLLAAPVARIAASFLVLVAVGATLTRLFFIGGNPIPPALLLVVLAVIIWGRHPFRVDAKA